MNKRKVMLFALVAVLVGAGFLYGLAAGTYHLPPYTLFQEVKNAVEQLGQDKSLPPMPEVLEEPSLDEVAAQEMLDEDGGLQSILQLIEAQQFQTQTETIDFVRDFVYNNSIHMIDEEFWEYAYDTPRVLEMLYDTYANDAPPPHLVCDPRSYAMAEILGHLSIRRRVVYVFTDSLGDEVQSHTFLEVYNEDFGRWEVQDPDYNVYWEDTRTGERVSTLQLVLDDLEAFEPRSSSAERVAFALEHLKPYYFEALVYPGGSGVVNIERFDHENPFLSDLDEYPLLYVQGFSSP
jgi:hypothetical protein